MKGSEFFKDSTEPREQKIKSWIMSGFFPSWFQPTKEIKVTDSAGNVLQYYVTPDYFALGEDNDYVIMPCNPLTFNTWLDQNHCMLPTKTMVNQIFNSSNKLAALPCTPQRGESITSLRLYQEIDTKVKASLKPPQSHAVNLFAGHKKDVVLANELAQSQYKAKVAIYGWWYKGGKDPIQGLNYKSHSVTYVDYSHGLRGVSKECLLNGINHSLVDILQNETLCHLVHDKKLTFLRYQ